MDKRPWIALSLLVLAGCSPEPPLVCRTATFGTGPTATWPDTLGITALPSDTATNSLRGDPAAFPGAGAKPLAVAVFHRPVAIHYRICQSTTREGAPTTQCMTRIPDTELLLVADFPRVPVFEQDTLFARTDRAAKSIGKEMARCQQQASTKTP